MYNCSLERAFKAPMLCDVTKVHTGMGLMPRIIATSDDKDWGKPGATKKRMQPNRLLKKVGLFRWIKYLNGLKTNTGKLRSTTFNHQCLASTNLWENGIQLKLKKTKYGSTTAMHFIQATHYIIR